MAALGAHPMAAWHLQFVPREGLGELAAMVPGTLNGHVVDPFPPDFDNWSRETKTMWWHHQKEKWKAASPEQRKDILAREKAYREERWAALTPEEQEQILARREAARKRRKANRKAKRAAKKAAKDAAKEQT